MQISQIRKKFVQISQIFHFSPFFQTHIGPGCQNNITLVWFSSNSTLFSFQKPFSTHNQNISSLNEDDQQLQAVLYIIVVLMFYSISIASAMIKYMYQEGQQATEDQMYQDFLTKTKQLAMQQVDYRNSLKN